jgi:glycosyltransferase involved in cell wall biosynthesis
VLTLSAPDKDTLRPQFAQLGVSVLNISMRVVNALPAIIKVRRLLLDGQFQIAAATCIRADAVLAIASTGIGALKSVTTVQNVPAEDLAYLYPGWKGRAAGWLHYQVLKRYRNRIICCSTLVRDHLRERIRSDGRRILNPVVAPTLALPELVDKPTIVFAASLSARKHPTEALAFVLATLAPASFLFEVFGRGPLEAQLQDTYRDRREIAWRGFTDNLAEIFARARAYVSASRSEGFPLTPQLALIYGCPCVLSDIPQHEELAGLSQFVYLYRAGDQADFSRALRSALQADRVQARNEGTVLREKIAPELVAIEIRTFYLSM